MNIDGCPYNSNMISRLVNNIISLLCVSLSLVSSMCVPQERGLIEGDMVILLLWT
jgi:hypothetical protein